MMKSQPYLTVVLPCFNEARRLPGTLGEVLPFLSAQPFTWEVLVVDDGSTDSTAAVVQPYLADERVRFLSLAVNRGKGGAIQAGVQEARGELILFADADAATPFSEFSKLQAALAPDVAVVIGSRSMLGATVKRTQPLHRVVIGKIGNWLIRAILGLPFRDTQCGFKVFRADAAKQLFSHLRFLRWSFDFEVLMRASMQGLRVVEVPVRWEHREDSKFSPLKDAVRCFLDVLVLRAAYVRWFEVGMVMVILGLQAVFFMLFRSRSFVNWDAAQFGLGTAHFDLAMHQPHPPGYPLFVAFGALLQTLLGDANLALSLLSFAATLIATLSLWRIARRESLRAAIAVSVLFATNPVVLFVQGSALTYAFDAMVVSILILLLVRARAGGTGSLFGVAVTALAMGFRPSVLLPALPLLLWLWWCERPTVRRTIELVVLGSAVSAAWLVPFAYVGGGFSVVWHETVRQFTSVRFVPVHDLNATRFLVLSFAYATVVLPVLAISTLALRRGTRVMVGTGASLALTLLFFGRVHFGETGYLLAVIPLLLFIALPTIAVLAVTRLGQVLLVTVVITQLVLYAGVAASWLPPKVQRMSAPAVAAHDASYSAVLAMVRRMDPATTLVVVRRGAYVAQNGEARSHTYDDIRALEYDLPEYRLYDMVGVPGMYGLAWNHLYARKEESVIFFPSAFTTLVIVTDELSADDAPSGRTVLPVLENGDGATIYATSLDGVDSFSLFGFHMQRSGTYD